MSHFFYHVSHVFHIHDFSVQVMTQLIREKRIEKQAEGPDTSLKDLTKEERIKSVIQKYLQKVDLTDLRVILFIEFKTIYFIDIASLA